MREKIRILIKRVDESLESARLLVDKGYNDASVSDPIMLCSMPQKRFC